MPKILAVNQKNKNKMGSAKHMRSNGEQINIHGHDNYQMPGAYKQMGDKNQNQPAQYEPMQQPGKISGGAAQYIKDSYSASKVTDPTKDPTKDKIAADAKIKSNPEFDINSPLPEGSDDSGTGGFTGSPNANKAYKKYQTEDYAAGRGPSTPNANVAGGSIPGKYPQMDAVRSFGSNNELPRGMKGDAPRGTASNPQNEKARSNMINELTTFMGVPTNSQRMVDEKINTMKSGTSGKLITDIVGGGKKKKPQ